MHAPLSARILTDHEDDRERRGRPGMPAHYREVILLRDLEGLTIEEMADQLGLSWEAVTSRLHRARVLAREYLDS